jgi:hypothetical protein
MINSSPWKIPKINGSLYIAGKIIDINGPSIPWRTVKLPEGNPHLGCIDGKCYHIEHTWILWD